MDKARIAFLQAMPIFGGMSEPALETLLGNARCQQYNVGENLVLEGDPPGDIFILEWGQVSVSKTIDDQNFFICYLSRGDCFGEMSLIDPQSRSATVKATELCRAICLGFQDLHHLRQVDLAQFTLLQLNIAREIARRLRALESRLFRLMSDKDCDIPS